MQIFKSCTTFCLLFAACVLAPNSTDAAVKVGAVLGDHMVLQREKPVAIWGTAEVGEKITVKFNTQTKTTIADKKGNWRVNLDAMKANAKPQSLAITGTNTIELKNILVGEVWIGSGQSNMAGGAGGYARRDEVLAKMIKGGPYPKLRLYRRGGWREATEKNIAGFSALLFSFGLPLQQELDVPVGLMLGAVGGTPSGRWLSPEMLQDDKACVELLKKAGISGTFEQRQKKYQTELATWKQAVKLAKEQGKKPPRRPRGPLRVGDLYAAFIQPMVPYTIRGVLWDQGESGTAVKGIDQYTMMGALIRGWRKTWGQGDFAFLYVQKLSGGGCAWDVKGNLVTAYADKFAPQPTAPNQERAGDYRALHIKIMNHAKTAMVTASDLGSGIHPINKSGYGRRATRVALGFVYDKKIEIYGPIYKSHEVKADKIHITYNHVGKGLAAKHSDKLQGFEIADQSGKWHWADAKIVDSTVIVSNEKIKAPTNVRYGWSRKRSWANLFNKDGLPALTFKAK